MIKPLYYKRDYAHGNSNDPKYEDTTEMAES